MVRPTDQGVTAPGGHSHGSAEEGAWPVGPQEKAPGSGGEQMGKGKHGPEALSWSGGMGEAGQAG